MTLSDAVSHFKDPSQFLAYARKHDLKGKRLQGESCIVSKVLQHLMGTKYVVSVSTKLGTIGVFKGRERIQATSTPGWLNDLAARFDRGEFANYEEKRLTNLSEV